MSYISTFLTEKILKTLITVITIATSSSSPFKSLNSGFSPQHATGTTCYQQLDSHSLSSYVPSTISEKLRTSPLSSLLTWLPRYHSWLEVPSVSSTDSSSTCSSLKCRKCPHIQQGFPQFWSF